MAKTGPHPKETVKLTTRHVVEARANLARKASQLLDRLHKNALGELRGWGEDDKGERVQVPIEMSQGQISSARIVLAKIIPDLQSMAVESPPEQLGSGTKEQLLLRLQTLLVASPELKQLLPKLTEVPIEEVKEELASKPVVIDQRD